MIVAAALTTSTALAQFESGDPDESAPVAPAPATSTPAPATAPSATAPAATSPTAAPPSAPTDASTDTTSRRNRRRSFFNNSAGGSGGAGAAPFTPSAPLSPAAAARLLPPEYQVLAQKSMFSKDRRPRVEPVDPGAAPPATQTAAAPSKPALPVLRGAGVIEDVGDDGTVVPVPAAVFEMPDGARLTLYPGDTVPGDLGGAITGIDIAGVTLSPKAGRPTRILLGQDLSGGDAPAPDAAPPAPAVTPPALGERGGGNTFFSFGRPGGTSGAAPAAPAGDAMTAAARAAAAQSDAAARAREAEILEAMRRRRQQESNR